MSMVTAAHFAKEKPLQQATDTFSVEHAQIGRAACRERV